ESEHRQVQHLRPRAHAGAGEGNVHAAQVRIHDARNLRIACVGKRQQRHSYRALVGSHSALCRPVNVRDDLTAGLIGQRLIEAGYLTREQLQEALDEQRRTAMLLGEVCILRGWLTYEQVRECLPNIRSRLGNRLLAEKRITMEQLWLAILEQR